MTWPAAGAELDDPLGEALAGSASQSRGRRLGSLRGTVLGDVGAGAADGSAARALAALNPGRRAVKALAVVAGLVVLIAAYVAWSGRPHTEVVPPVPPSVTAPRSSAPAPASASAEIVVAVQGRVRHPGLVHLPAGARVADALAAAGGVLPGTDLSFVNLARKVTDGELIVVGVTPPPGATLDPDPSGGSPAAGAPVNLNTATEADLETLPGIGPALAQRIIDYRTQHGGFHSVDELRNVSGIGDAKYAEIANRVTV